MTDRTHLRKTDAAFFLVVAFLLVALLYLLFGHLGESPIESYDEARHGVNAYEMIRNSDYLVQTYQGLPDYWNLKPPLSFWLISLAYRLFGYNAFALRFFSAFSGLLTALAVALWSWKRCGRWTAVLTLAIFTANRVFFGLHFARYGDADAQYQLFFTLAILSTIMCDRGFRWLYCSAICFGLAFLEKGFHAVNIPMICFLILLCNRQIDQLSTKRFFLLLAAGLLLVFSWAIARYSRDGTAFLARMFSTDVANRIGSVADPVDTAIPALLYYLTPLIRSPGLLLALSLCVLCCMIILLSGHRLSPAQRRAAIGCFIWFTIPILFYSLANVKYRWYVYSCLIAVPALTAVFAGAVMDRLKGQKIFPLLFCIVFVLFSSLSVQNIKQISEVSFHHTIQGFLKESLDRETDSGHHAYIQYNENNSTEWMPADMLTALYSGDVVCENGGVAGYQADSGDALLYLCKENNLSQVETLQEQEAVRDENYYLLVFEK